ncbi:MAG: hypothetical protein EAX96_18605 [Candidatus Lokiarchaeota archaeon]|nr:hypothetical protein [Candidatus Lokiarchaeota archaeon]
MSSVQLERISEEVKSFVENLTYNGLNLVTMDSIKQIELFLQNASKVKAFRLATSLRYLHIELKRFLDRSKAFNINRYIFFLSNCWLLCRAFLNLDLSKAKEHALYDKLLGKVEEFNLIKEVKLRLIGVEKVSLEGVMFGFIFYFIAIEGKNKGKIYKWSLMQPPKGGIQPELLLSLSLSNSQPASSINGLFFRDIQVENLPCSETDCIIRLMGDQKTKIKFLKPIVGHNKDPFPIEYLGDYHFSSKEILNKINKREITPFDITANFVDYIYIKNVQILDFKITGEDESKTTSIIFATEHSKDFPIYIKIQDKVINQNLIESLKENAKNKTKIFGMFGKLILEKGKLGLYPLGLFDGTNESFPVLMGDHFIDNREILKELYKK